MAKGPRDDDVEKARQESIKSYRKLVDKAFSNILNDTEVVVKASRAMTCTGEIVGNAEDKDTGEFMTQLMQALHDAAEALREKYVQKFEGTSCVERIGDAEWDRLDRTLEKTEWEDE